MPNNDLDHGRAELGYTNQSTRLQKPEVIRTAKLLQSLIRGRRFQLDEFVEGNGPYWIALGLFVNDDAGVETSIDQIVDFADESLETGRYLLKQMMEANIVQQYSTSASTSAYRLTPPFTIQFERHIRHQYEQIRDASLTG